MTIEFTPGEKYQNRRGQYELIEITAEGRLKVRYLSDGLVAELDRAAQERIILNMQTEAEVAAANAAKLAASAPAPRATATATPKAAAIRPASVPRSVATPKAAPAPRRVAEPKPAAPVRSRDREEYRVTLKVGVPVRSQFSKLEIFRLLQFIGLGKSSGDFWFIGSGEAFFDEGKTVLSELVANEDFMSDYADAALYKTRFLEEGGHFYGSNAWQAANYLVTRMKLPADEQTEEARRRYFTESFGAREGDVLWASVNSLPTNAQTPSITPSQWIYSNISVTDSPLYDRTLRDPQMFMNDNYTGRETRVERLRDLYADMKQKQTAPQYVFCHGKLSYWNVYKDIFPFVQTYTEMELQAYTDRDKPVRTAIGRDPDNGTLIILLPPLLPSEGVTIHYLDQVIQLCAALSGKK
jgi:hypothetical protein